MKMIYLLVFGLISGVPVLAEIDFIAELSKNEAKAKGLGIAKLSNSERTEWNKLLAAVYKLGAESQKNAAAVQNPPVNSGHTIEPGKAASSGSIWLSKADLNGEEIIKLRNGAVFEISTGFVGMGFGRDVALIKEGTKWSLWVEGKREYRGSLLKNPEVGISANFRRSSIQSVSSEGSIIKLLDGSIYEVDSIGRIDTSLWLPGSEVFVIDETALLNVSGDGGGVVQVRLLK